ncbi:glycosyltransferase family 39 protein [Candidatus Dojkabacteria bacterium]|nr:glycosyltransferase family 39 protein [Candidatus Dojkabacteria bacterium]
MKIRKLFADKYKIIFILAILILILLRIPSLFEPRWHGDEGIYAAVANEMSHGEKLYVDAWDHKPPAIYVLYWIGSHFGNNNLFFVKTLNLVAAIGTLIFIKKLATQFFNKKVSLIVSALFVLMIASKIFEGNIANAENFFMFFTTLGMYLYLNARNSKSKVFSGLSFSVGVLFKIHPLFDFIALIFFILLIAIRKKEKIKNLVFDMVYVVTPFVLLQLWTFVITGLLIGSFSEYIFTNITYNLGYTGYTEAAKAPSILSFESLTFRAGLTVLVFVISGFLYYRKKISDKLLLLILWFTAGLFAAFLSARAYLHYALQVLPAFVLMVGMIVYWVEKSKKLSVKILLALVPIVLLIGTFSGFFPVVKSVKGILKEDDPVYYTSFLKRAMGKISTREYNDVFDKKVNDMYDLIEFIRESAGVAGKENDGQRISVFLWGKSAWFYDLVNADNPSRYVVDFHIGSKLGRRSELMYDLETTRPEFIVQEKGKKLFEKKGNKLRAGQRSLDEFVKEDYELIGVDIGGRYMVYRIIN